MKDRKVDTLNLWKLICNNDDEKAFELLFHLLNNSLTKFCILYVNQREIAEEIVSDVFVKCWLNRKTLTEILNPETYLFVAVKNQSLNHIKKYSSIHLVQIEETNSVEFVNTYNPQREIENKELIFRMDKAITALPQQCRIVFRLIKEDGMKYKEVAEILNISPRTVQTQLFRAVKKLSIVLSNYDKLNNPKVHTSNIFKALSVIIGIWQLFFINL
ncbi:RNA polymerase sigma-70 factor [Mucilaginibacter sp. HC2]|uniref:RNA polymerase sigma-70 factor n=1 Tax=Mucilaginibacter inviolabilis TaxID=2714892 RepID=UPI00140C4A57|nr:RNA polymerase sigma-70 factor [Mucilaginibacter inviolabilis]NHA03137.1 RNA polymerase sigma-70 factor [Mucilaginibacter inviolabilis]